MAYKLRCNACRQVFTGANRHSICGSCRPDRDYGNTVLEDIAEVAVGLAIGYATGSLIESAAESAIDVVGGLFDW